MAGHIRFWNRCDECGRFIPYEDFASGKAERVYVQVDLGEERYETLCREHANR